MKLVNVEQEGAYATITIEMDADDIAGEMPVIYMTIAHQMGLHPKAGQTAKDQVLGSISAEEAMRRSAGFLMSVSAMKGIDLAGCDIVGEPKCSYEEPPHEGESFTYQMQVALVPQMELTSYDSVSVPSQESVLEGFKNGGQRDPELGATQYRRYIAVSKLSQRLDGNVPDEAFEAAYNELLQSFRTAMRERDMTEEDYFAKEGTNAQDFKASLMMQTREQLRQELALDALARHEGMELTEDDVREYCREQAPGREAQYASHAANQGGMRSLKLAALRTKANKWLVETASIED